MRTFSLAELYGGKICVALDRQLPRDLSDVHRLLKAEGITNEIRRAFFVFLASHDRPINELRSPNRQRMTLDPVPPVLESAREQLIQQINHNLTTAAREFLLSMKRLEPKWERSESQIWSACPDYSGNFTTCAKWCLQNATRPNSYSERSLHCERQR